MDALSPEERFALTRAAHLVAREDLDAAQRSRRDPDTGAARHRVGRRGAVAGVEHAPVR